MRRNQWMSGLVIGLGLGMGASAAVAAPALPAAAKAHVADMRTSCKDAGGRPGRSPELVQIADVTGDGRADYVINEGAFDCVGAESYFSGGSGGSSVSVYVSDTTGSAKQAFTHGVFGVHMERSGQTARVWLGVGGPLCGQKQFRSRAEAEDCWRPLQWKGGKLDFAPVSQKRPYSAFATP